jgi:hypothetical protein
MTDNIDLADLEIGLHVLYTFRLGGIELTHGTTVEQIPPWTDQSGEDHDHILLRRPDERVVRISLDEIVELEPRTRRSDGN